MRGILAVIAIKVIPKGLGCLTAPSPPPSGGTTSHSTRQQAAKSLVISQTGEGDKVSLRDVDIY